METEPPSPEPTRAGGTGLIVAESLALVRDGLARLLAEWPHGAVRTAGTLDAALAMVAADEASVLLLDLELLRGEGPAGLRSVCARHPALRIVAVAARQSRDETLQCLVAGAQGYIAKAAGFAELARAIETVRTGGVHIPAIAASEPDRSLPVRMPGGLTGRQRDVLRLLAEGRSTKDIARTLDLAVSTIKVHLAALYRAVGARNRVEALCRAGRVPGGGLGHDTA